jgi:hypothetical protein
MDGMARSALLIDAALLASEPSPGALAFLKRMNAAGVALVPLGAVDAAAWSARGTRLEEAVTRDGWRPRVLLTALGAVAAEVSSSWVVCTDAAAAPAAATAGMAGVVLIGAEPPREDLGIAVTSAGDLADLPRALVPRGGGCWHER